MIDYYDVLGIELDADGDAVRKAFRQKSRDVHPDKVNAGGLTLPEGRTREDLFNEVKLANDVLKDPERRKLYDTFGFDLGEERPEMEVWNIGLTMLLSPLGSFSLKTLVARVALSILAYRWIRSILFLGGIALVGLYAININIRGVSIRSPDIMPYLLNIGVINIVVVLHWVWPLLAETVSVMYLVTEVAGLHLLLDNLKIGGAAAFGSLIFAWLARAWWTWIIGLEVALGLFLLIALTVSTGLMHLWLDQVKATKGQSLMEFRIALRRERKRIQDEISRLKGKINHTALLSNSALVEAHRKKLKEQEEYWTNRMKEEEAAKVKR